MSNQPSFREVGFYLRARLGRGIGRALNRRARAPVEPVATVDEVIAGPDAPVALSRLIIGRSNTQREAAVARFLGARGVPFCRHAFSTFEGRGENYSVDVGEGPRVLALIAHHDAVPGSPGANDNAAAVGILLHLMGRLARTPPAGLRVRFLFPAAEEVGYLGTRQYVKDTPPEGIAGVLSLELCGRGDSIVVWDAAEQEPFLAGVTSAMESAGLRRDEGYHVVGRIPVFGSDHRAFAAAGVPAYGFTIVPAREADALRRFVLSPGRNAVRNLFHRPPPFDTYHTAGDAFETLEPAACDAVAGVLEAVIGRMSGSVARAAV